MNRFYELINKVELTVEELEELKGIDGVVVMTCICANIYYEVVCNDIQYYVYYI